MDKEQALKMRQMNEIARFRKIEEAQDRLEAASQGKAGYLHAEDRLKDLELVTGKTGGTKNDDGKLRYDLLPPSLLKGVATILTF
ncbi:MAG: hypothetical protein IIC18_10525, partial [Bacteroidetes bacterium]|nr:hypothetical protein [Bacteroidota bacterium]